MVKFFVLFIILQAANLYAQIYTWTDQDGIRHFSNGKLPKSVDRVEIYREDSDQSSCFLEMGKTAAVKVVKVYDGDSIQVTGYNLSFGVRLVGIDAPESGGRDRPGQPFSRSAKRFLENLISGREVMLIPYGIDGYNRQLAEIFIREKNVNLELVKAGLAEVYRGKFPKGFDAIDLNRAEAAARRSNKGIWSLGKAYISPRQWRKLHPLEH